MPGAAYAASGFLAEVMSKEKRLFQYINDSNKTYTLFFVSQDKCSVDKKGELGYASIWGN